MNSNSKIKNSNKNNPHLKHHLKTNHFSNQGNTAHKTENQQDQEAQKSTSSHLESEGQGEVVSPETDIKDLAAENNLLKVQLDTLQKEVADWQDKAVRAFADIQNIARQNELDLQQAKKSTKKSLSTTILGLINTLNLAFVYLPDNLDEKMQQFVNALKLSLNQAIESFRNQGVEILIPEIGTTFNPEYMNVLNSDQIADPENVVVKQVVGVGLKIDNQVVQPVSIMV